MVDCLTDSCTDFSFAYIDTVGCARPLAGTLTATPAHADEYLCLTDLAAYACKLGYLTEIHGHTLTIKGITLPDALAVNHRFSEQLIISCDLRRDPPVLFG